MEVTHLRIASDLHLEAFSGPASANATRFLPEDSHDASSILVLAGDISSKPIQLVEFLNSVGTFC